MRLDGWEMGKEEYMATAEIIQIQKKLEAQFICSACGADRGCNCNAPAIERALAAQERRRVAERERRKNTSKNNNRVVHGEQVVAEAWGQLRRASDTVKTALETLLELKDRVEPTMRRECLAVIDAALDSLTRLRHGLIEGEIHEPSRSG
jgi:hypothetical protein